MGIVCFDAGATGATGAVERIHALGDDDDEGGADEHAHSDC